MKIIQKFTQVPADLSEQAQTFSSSLGFMRMQKAQIKSLAEKANEKAKDFIK